ncbi:MAG: YggS family pyridoxal phosphate-dependent enzyme [Candidatus Lambdaproteobacteria bacterium]|nr:YggS family pyridoxal phosphate-dependent enzyme [Candidatus Lambdaproteobacteria bacterium]
MAPSIAENLAQVRGRIAEAARRSGRPAEAIALVAVSKTKPLAAVVEAWQAGQRLFGENRVQEALPKIAQAPAELEWHLIGHVQTNKARQVPGRFRMLESLDSPRLARELDRHAREAGVWLDALIQLNWCHEPSKTGVRDEQELEALIAAVRSCPGLRLRGLMTIPDPALSEPDTRRHFAAVRELQQRLARAQGLDAAFDQLSMGMTHDFEWAIEEGATLVRVGTAIFGARA